MQNGFVRDALAITDSCFGCFLTRQAAVCRRLWGGCSIYREAAMWRQPSDGCFQIGIRQAFRGQNGFWQNIWKVRNAKLDVECSCVKATVRRLFPDRYQTVNSSRRRVAVYTIHTVWIREQSQRNADLKIDSILVNPIHWFNWRLLPDIFDCVRLFRWGKDFCSIRLPQEISSLSDFFLGQINLNQCTRSSRVPRLDNIMVFLRDKHNWGLHK